MRGKLLTLLVSRGKQSVVQCEPSPGCHWCVYCLSQHPKKPQMPSHGFIGASSLQLSSGVFFTLLHFPLSCQPLLCSEHSDFYPSLLKLLLPEFYPFLPPLWDHFLSVQEFSLAKEGRVWWLFDHKMHMEG